MSGDGRDDGDGEDQDGDGEDQDGDGEDQNGDGEDQDGDGEDQDGVGGGGGRKKPAPEEPRPPACGSCTSCIPPPEKEDPEFDRIAEKLQARIDSLEEEYFSPGIIRECKYPRNVGRMNDPDATASVGTVGESIEFHMRFGPDGRVSEALFNTDGCGTTIACGSMLTQMVKGKSREELARLKVDDLVRELGGVPPAQMHCAELAMDALGKALGSEK